MSGKFIAIVFIVGLITHLYEWSFHFLFPSLVSIEYELKTTSVFVCFIFRPVRIVAKNSKTAFSAKHSKPVA